MEDKLVFCEPGKKYVSLLTGDALVAEVETILEPVGNKTEMSIKWSGKGKILFLRVFLPLFRRKIKNLASRDLESFRKLVEERGPVFIKEFENSL
jgi:hypothetical protein